MNRLLYDVASTSCLSSSRNVSSSGTEAKDAGTNAAKAESLSRLEKAAAEMSYNLLGAFRFEVIPRTDAPIVAFSGRKQRIEEWLGRRPGHIYQATGFLSLSLNLKAVVDGGYVDLRRDPPCCLLRVRIPAGVRSFLPRNSCCCLPERGFK
jgi:hypothetical protein